MNNYKMMLTTYFYDYFASLFENWASFVSNVGNKNFIVEKMTPAQILIGKTMNFDKVLFGGSSLLTLLWFPIKTMPIPKTFDFGFFSYFNNTIFGPFAAYTGNRKFANVLRDFDKNHENNFLVQFFLHFFNLKAKRDLLGIFSFRHIFTFFSFQNKKYAKFLIEIIIIIIIIIFLKDVRLFGKT